MYTQKYSQFKNMEQQQNTPAQGWIWTRPIYMTQAPGKIPFLRGSQTPTLKFELMLKHNFLLRQQALGEKATQMSWNPICQVISLLHANI